MKRITIFTLQLLSLSSLLVGAVALSHSESCGDVFALSARFAHTPAIHALATLRVRLDRGRAHNGRKRNPLERDYNEKFRELLRAGAFNSRELHDLIQNEVHALTAESLINLDPKDADQARDVQDILARYRFPRGTRNPMLRVQAGRFKHRIQNPLTNEFESADVRLTRDFAMASFLTTRQLWDYIIVRSDEKFLGAFSDDGLALQKDGDEQFLLPVTSISDHDVLAWFKRLNALSSRDDRLLQFVLPGHIAGATYRLPTETEWDFVASQRGTVDNLPFSKERAHDYAVIAGSQTSGIQPVGTKLAILVGGQPFYDLFGNVKELVSTYLGPILKGGDDPSDELPEQNRNSRITKGGDYQSSANNLFRRDGLRSGKEHVLVGFRILMEVPRFTNAVNSPGAPVPVPPTPTR